MKKQTIFLMVAGLVFVFFIVFFSFYQAAKVQRESESALKPLEKEMQPTVLPQEQRKLVPARPEDYGITVIKPGEEPKTQEEWDMFFAQEIKSLKARTPPETWSKVQAKIRDKPKETQEAMARLEELMKGYTEELKKNPEDKELQEKLQRLMILKSIQKELPDK